MESQKKYCQNCKKEIPPNKKGPYKDYCGYVCDTEDKQKQKKLSGFTK